MLNEKFWLAVSFTCFVILMIKLVIPTIRQSLDAKSKAIADELAAAKEMKEKAEELLSQAKKFHKESEGFAEKLVNEAQAEAEKFAAEAKKAAEEEVSKKTAASIERIKMEEVIAIRELKQKIVSSTIQSVTDSMTNEVDDNRHNHLLNQSLKDLEESTKA